MQSYANNNSRLHQCRLTQHTNQTIIIQLLKPLVDVYRGVTAGGRNSFSWFVSNVYVVLGRQGMKEYTISTEVLLDNCTVNKLKLVNAKSKG